MQGNWWRLPEERRAEGNSWLTPALYGGFNKKHFKQVLLLLCYSLYSKHCIYAERKEFGEQCRSFPQQERRETRWGKRKGKCFSTESECRIQARGLEPDGHPANSQQLKGLAGYVKQVCLAVKQALPARPGIFPDACAPPRHMEILIKRNRPLERWVARIEIQGPLAVFLILTAIQLSLTRTFWRDLVVKSLLPLTSFKE